MGVTVIVLWLGVKLAIGHRIASGFKLKLVFFAEPVVLCVRSLIILLSRHAVFNHEMNSITKHHV